MNKKMLISIFLLGVLYLSGCSNETNELGYSTVENVKSVKEGMSIEQVIEILGDDYKISDIDGMKVYGWFIYDEENEIIGSTSSIVNSQGILLSDPSCTLLEDLK